MERYMDTRSRSFGVWRALLIVVALIVYGCLYPFTFQPMPPHGWSVFWHSGPQALTRFIARDAFINVLLYLPFGMLAFLALDRVQNTWLHLLIPIVLACCLSTTLEFIQLMDFTRTSSVFDVACNTTGAALGVSPACSMPAQWPGCSRAPDEGNARPDRPPAAVLPLAGVSSLPDISFGRNVCSPGQTPDAARRSSFSVPDAISTSIEWLAAAAL